MKYIIFIGVLVFIADCWFIFPRFRAFLRKWCEKPKKWWNEIHTINVYVDPTGFKDIGDAINHYHKDIPLDRKVATRLILPGGSFSFKIPIVFCDVRKVYIKGNNTVLVFQEGAYISADINVDRVSFDNCALIVNNNHFENSMQSQYPETYKPNEQQTNFPFPLR